MVRHQGVLELCLPVPVPSWNQSTCWLSHTTLTRLGLLKAGRAHGVANRGTGTQVDTHVHPVPAWRYLSRYVNLYPRWKGESRLLSSVDARKFPTVLKAQLRQAFWKGKQLNSPRRQLLDSEESHTQYTDKCHPGAEVEPALRFSH